MAVPAPGTRSAVPCEEAAVRWAVEGGRRVRVGAATVRAPPHRDRTKRRIVITRFAAS